MKRNKSAVLEALRNAAVSEPLSTAFLERQRWGDCAACPRCGDVSVYPMMGRDGQRNTDYRWRCRGCKEMFTVRTGTIFEETRLPLRVWIYAIWKACSSKKGISALQLSREMEITHKSALFILRRIRHGLGELDQPRMKGTIEVDEHLSCRIITDEAPVYKFVGKFFEGGHEVVTHKAKEYVRTATDVHSYTVEGVFSLIRRGVMGTFHSVSRKHLPNYLNEFQFRWNTRKMNDGERVPEAIKAIKAIDGKRLQYRESVEDPPYLTKAQEQPEKQMEAPF